MRANFIFNVLGSVLKYFSVVLFLPIIFAILWQEPNHITPFAVCALSALGLGFLFKLKTIDFEQINDLKKSEGLCIVFFSWILFGLICTIPYLFYDLSLINSLFESFSGITTTGTSILIDYTLYPKTFFFFRAMTQWLGGMGIIILFIAVLPKFAVAGRQMFSAEAPGPVEEKFTPRIHQTALWLWTIYIGLTIAEILLLKFVGKIDLYHAICTAFATISTGGFATESSSVAAFKSNTVNWIIIIFMFLASCNFVLQYKVFIQKKFKEILKNEEFWVYFGIIAIASISISFILYFSMHTSYPQSLTNAVFTAISTISTTGFACVNYNLWNMDAKIILLALMFAGGCAASTSGGIKIVRWIFIFKYLKKEIAKIIHPNAVYPIKLDGAVIAKDVRLQLLAFIIFYFTIFGISAFLIGIIEKSPIVAISGSITTLGNIGIDLGDILGAVNGFERLHVTTKLIFIFNMVVGRLELIPFLALLHPDVWTRT